MVRKSSTSLPPLELKTFSSADEILRGITKLERRVQDLCELDPTILKWNDQVIKSLESKIQNTILEIFGLNSPEYREHQHHDIWKGALYMGMSEQYGQECFIKGIPQSISMLKGLIESLQEKFEDFEADSPARAYDTFLGLQLHPRIAEVASDLFKDGHYSEAIFEASKALVRLVQDRTGIYNIDGTPLMDKVFSKNKPILKFPPENPKDTDEQEGMMYLYKGVVLGIRNPKAHHIITRKPDEHRAIEYLAFISLLAERLNEANFHPENIS